MQISVKNDYIFVARKKSRSGGRAVRQRSAKPCTAVRIRSRPQLPKPDIDEISGFCVSIADSSSLDGGDRNTKGKAGRPGFGRWCAPPTGST